MYYLWWQHNEVRPGILLSNNFCGIYSPLVGFQQILEIFDFFTFAVSYHATNLKYANVIYN